MFFLHYFSTKFRWLKHVEVPIKPDIRGKQWIKISSSIAQYTSGCMPPARSFPSNFSISQPQFLHSNQPIPNSRGTSTPTTIDPREPLSYTSRQIIIKSSTNHWYRTERIIILYNPTKRIRSTISFEPKPTWSTRSHRALVPPITPKNYPRVAYNLAKPLHPPSTSTPSQMNADAAAGSTKSSKIERVHKHVSRVGHAPSPIQPCRRGGARRGRKKWIMRGKNLRPNK